MAVKRKRVKLVQIEVDGVLMDAKECTKCGEVKELKRFNYRNDRGTYRTDCKNCELIRHQKWLESNEAHRKEYEKAWYNDNRERKSELNQRWRKDNQFYESERCKKWAKDNPEKKQEHNQRRRARKAGLPDCLSKKKKLLTVIVDGVETKAKKCAKCNVLKVLGDFSKNKNGLGGVNSVCKECRKSYKKEWDQKNSEHVHNYYLANKEKIDARANKWKRENPQKNAQHTRNYRGRNIEKVKRYNEE